jgi:hypothetical protein
MAAMHESRDALNEFMVATATRDAGKIGEALGVTVFDPWFKPDVRGLKEYGREDEASVERIRRRWSYGAGRAGAKARAWCAAQFWETLHIDLRMVDTSDFTISYCPTNIYSVGTPHEIIMATLQHKPVLFVSPRVVFPSLAALRNHLRDDPEGMRLPNRWDPKRNKFVADDDWLLWDLRPGKRHGKHLEGVRR